MVDLCRLTALGDRTRTHMADPLFRNGYALMVNTAATGGLGVLYWLLAARSYDDADVGRGSATISAMMLLSGFTALNVTGMLTRFLPEAGRGTASLVRHTYLVSSLAAAAVAGLFLLTLGAWGSSSYAHLGGLTTGSWFTAAVVAWGIFTLQDGVLTGLRSAVWVPIKNTFFGVAKLALLVAFAATFPRDGVFLSWMIPVAVALLPINALIFGRLVPVHVRRSRPRADPPSLRRIGRFLAGDYIGAASVLATMHLVPVVVAARVEPATFAYFYIAWTIGGVVDLLAVNMAMSLTVEGAFDGERLAGRCRAALRRTLRILVPVALAMVALAPFGLAVLGTGYAEEGTRLLRLLALAALPRVLTELYLGALRVQSRTNLLAAVQVVRGVLVLGLALALTGAVGIAGAALAMLVGQLAVAVLVLPGLRRILLLERKPAASLPNAS